MTFQTREERMNCQLRVGESRLAVLLALILTAPAFSQEPADDGTDPGTGTGTTAVDFGSETIIRVEEDWLVDVGVTDENCSAPEIVTVFGPGDPNLGLHAVFEMNHCTAPSFSRGGMQLQAWWANWYLGSKRYFNEAELLTTVERVQYTCCTRLYDHRLYLEIKNGSSVTWGNFGGDSYLQLKLWSDRSNLNSYNPGNSIAHSRVTFGANRVNRFLRTEIRYYTADGDVIVDGTDTYVHQLADSAETPINE
jgi:hypothetical protein